MTKSAETTEALTIQTNIRVHYSILIQGAQKSAPGAQQAVAMIRRSEPGNVHLGAWGVDTLGHLGTQDIE